MKGDSQACSVIVPPPGKGEQDWCINECAHYREKKEDVLCFSSLVSFLLFYLKLYSEPGYWFSFTLSGSLAQPLCNPPTNTNPPSLSLLLWKLQYWMGLCVFSRWRWDRHPKQISWELHMFMVDSVAASHFSFLYMSETMEGTNDGVTQWLWWIWM